MERDELILHMLGQGYGLYEVARKLREPSGVVGRVLRLRRYREHRDRMRAAGEGRR